MLWCPFLPAAVLLFETALDGRQFKTHVFAPSRVSLFRLTREAQRDPRVSGPQPGSLAPLLSACPMGDCMCALNPPACPPAEGPGSTVSPLSTTASVSPAHGPFLLAQKCAMVTYYYYYYYYVLLYDDPLLKRTRPQPLFPQSQCFALCPLVCWPTFSSPVLSCVQCKQVCDPSVPQH